MSRNAGLLLTALLITHSFNSSAKEFPICFQIIFNYSHSSMESYELTNMAGLEDVHEGVDRIKYIRERFVTSVKSNNWFHAIFLLRDLRELRDLSVLRSERFSFDGTALHQAVQPFSNCRMRQMERLVELMEKEDLEVQDTFGRTALYLLIREYPERVDVAHKMVTKSEMLHTILPHHKTEPLFVEAERQEKGESMARLLYALTPRPALRVSDGALLISLGFRFQRFGTIFPCILAIHVQLLMSIFFRVIIIS